MSKIEELKQEIAARQAELDNLLSLGREGALKRVEELQTAMNAALTEIENLASTYGLTVTSFNKDQEATYIPTKEAFEAEFGYNFSESELGSYRELPTWVSSSDLC